MNGVPMHPVVTLVLLCVTAVAEIVGCYLPYLWLKDRAPLVVLLPSAASLALFVWLLSLHPVAAGRTYAAYGGVYVATALFWLRLADGVRPDTWDIAGSALAGAGMFVIMFGPRHAWVKRRDVVGKASWAGGRRARVSVRFRSRAGSAGHRGGRGPRAERQRSYSSLSSRAPEAGAWPGPPRRGGAREPGDTRRRRRGWDAP